MTDASPRSSIDHNSIGDQSCVTDTNSVVERRLSSSGTERSSIGDRSAVSKRLQPDSAAYPKTGPEYNR